MASTTLPDISVPEQVASKHSIHEQTVLEQTLAVHIESPTIPENVNEPVFTITSEDSDCGDEQINSTSTVVINSVQIFETNIPTNTSTNVRLFWVIIAFLMMNLINKNRTQGELTNFIPK